MRRQDIYDKKNMDRVEGKYKKEFVEEFKSSCKKLGITQSSVIRKAMEETIKKAKKEEEIKMKKVYEVEGREVEFEVGQVVNFGDLYDITGEEEELLESGSIAVYYNNGNDFDVVDFEVVTPAEPICDTKIRITDIHA